MGLLFPSLEPGKRRFGPGKYAGDYQIQEIRDEKTGKTRRKVLYSGVWMTPREPGPAVQRKLYGVVALALLLTVAYLRVLLLTHVGSGQLYVMIPLLAGLFPLMYLLMGVFSLPLRGRPMRRDQYMRSFIRASRSALALTVCAALGLLGTVLSRILKQDWMFLSGDWWFLILCVLVFPLSAGIILLLRGIDLAEKTEAPKEIKL